MNTTKYIGSSTEKITNASFLRGQAQFTDDVQLTDVAHVILVRSPYAHARIEKVDLSKALRLPGDIAAFSGEDLKEYPITPLVDLEPHRKYGATDTIV